MKYSDYNILFDTDDKNKKYLVNTFTGETFKISNEIALSIQNKDIDILPKEVFDEYVKKGIIIKDSFNEIETLKYIQNHSKFNSNILSLTIFMTMDCNFRCLYCFEGLEKEKIYINHTIRNRVFKFIENILNENKNINVVSITLFGGEPLMKFEDNYAFLRKIKNLCIEKEKTFITSIVTNGSLITNSRLEFLKEINCQTIQITLDGEKDSHNKRRIDCNQNGTFEMVIEGIKKVIEYEGLNNPIIRINIDKENVSGIKNLIKYLDEENLNKCNIDFGIIRDMDTTMTYNEKYFTDNEIGDVLLDLWNELNKYGFNYSKSPIERSLYCGSYSNTTYSIYPNGDLYKCWEMAGKEEFKIGQLNDKGILENVSSHLFEWMNRGIDSIQDCEKCKYLPLCGCGCASVSYQNNNNIFTKGCFKTKSLIKVQLLNNLKING